MARRIRCKTKNYWRAYKTKRKKEFDSIWYKNLRRLVFARDNYTCALTGKKGGVLHMHHIKRYADYPSLRFDPRNLITLSEEAHKLVTGRELKYLKVLWKIAQERERKRKLGKANRKVS